MSQTNGEASIAGPDVGRIRGLQQTERKPLVQSAEGQGQMGEPDGAEGGQANHSVPPPPHPPSQTPLLQNKVEGGVGEGPPTFGRSIKLSNAQVDQAVRQRALDLLKHHGHAAEGLDFLLRAEVHRSPNGGATVTWEE